LGWWHLRYGDGYIETLIVYGLVTNPETVTNEIERTSPDIRRQLSGKHALLTSESSAIRLSSPGWIDLNTAGRIEINSSELLFALTQEKIISRISPFSKSTRMFVERYFEFVCKQTNNTRKTNPENEVFGQKDWVFSSWLPLPHAQILLSDHFNPTKISFAEFDVCFWTGRDLICVQIDQTNTIIKSKREKVNFLAKDCPEVKIISVPKNKSQKLDSDFPSDLFDESFGKFWIGLDLPHGPNPPVSLLSNINPLASKKSR